MSTRWPKPLCLPPQIAGVALTFLVAVLHTPFTFAQEQPPPWLICGPYPPSGNYTENSTYQGNINRLSGTLPKNVSSSPVLYATDSVGSVPNIVYALALCRGDANTSSCESCVAAAFQGAQKGCPLFKDVLIFYDLCQLRFSNRNFFPDTDNFITTYHLVGSQVVSKPTDAFDAAVRLLVNTTAGYAAENSSRRFATGAEGFDGSNPRIYALAQCTPDKTVDFCQSCFGPIMPEDFSGVNGGGVFGTWCSFRYEVYPFFSGRPLLQLPVFVGTPTAPAPASAPATRSQEKSMNKAGKVLEILMPAIAAMLVITVICFWTRRRRLAAQSFQPYSTSSDDIQGGDDMLLLDLSTLRVATEDFDETKMLGKGGFGMVYKGVLPDGQEIAVKRLCHSSRQGIEELKSELVLVAKLHHKNLVRLIGVCLQEHEKILVYEYMPNRSLDTILFDCERNKELDWAKRFNIISGIARGLQYLHEDSQLKIVHRDLKASNILLDFDYVPKISDFGLAKIFDGDQSKYVTRRVAGTYGYMAPEYAMRGLYSIKSDVFSFGVLVLEIVTGRRNGGLYNSEQDVDLLNLVWEHWARGNVVALIDPSLNDHPPIEQILKCLHIGLLCVQRNPAARPIMSWVNVMLSSSTVRLPSLSRPALCIQEVSATDSSDAYSPERPGASGCTDRSVLMSCNEASITELSPR
ncbi:cysteine-rich receptor-like protein kinase 6 [Miscanthus floridulus]|uniref:cysteine-rich receptor-like protein kinase 6 n=1 Tax=Miscanthus floridulus TaxID=154761 RepID=UPI003458A3AC